MTTIDEFYKVGPGPSSSHTIGPMRITYDFYQRCTKLPADQLAKATALKVHLFGSLSATGKGHGTERAALAGIIGKEPATVDPALPRRAARQAGPDLPGEARRQDLQRLAQGHHLRRAQGRLPAPQHDDLQADGAATPCCSSRSTTRSAAGSSSGRATSRRRRAQPKYPYATMKELLAHAEKNKLSVAQVAMANEVAVSGKSEAEINAFLDKITDGDGQHREVRARGAASTLPGPIKLQDQGRRRLQARDGRQVRGAARRRRGGGLRAGRLGGERARPPGGHGADRRLGRRHAGARLRARARAAASCRRRRSATACWPAAAIGYLCKHNATLSGAEGGCQAEIGVASAMGAALHRPGARLATTRWSPTPPSRRCSITSA